MAPLVRPNARRLDNVANGGDVEDRVGVTVRLASGGTGSGMVTDAIGIAIRAWPVVGVVSDDDSMIQ